MATEPLGVTGTVHPGIQPVKSGVMSPGLVQCVSEGVRRVASTRASIHGGDGEVFGL
jgi:hypothetical protein